MSLGGDCQRRWLLLFAVLGACHSPYEPALVKLAAPLDHTAFDTVADILRQRFQRLVLADRHGFKLQTRWAPFAHREVPGDRRATIYREDDGQLRVLIEVRYFGIGWDGMPDVTPTTGDARAEEELAGVLDRALARLRR